MRKITITPDKLWDYLKKQDEAGNLDNTMFEIASNDEFGVEIYVTKDDGSYRIVVDADGYEVEWEQIISASDAELTCNRFYENYLTANAVDMFASVKEQDSEYEELDEQDEIDSRELELSDAVSTFISDVLGGASFVDDCDFDEIVEDCKDHFLEYLARKHNFDIFRPMILEDEDGKDFFAEYPYECMVFEDENNPVYQA